MKALKRQSIPKLQGGWLKLNSAETPAGPGTYLFSALAANGSR